MTLSFQTLSDKDKRKVYDRSGEEGVSKMGGGGGGHDPFSSFFGDFFGGGGHDRDDQVPRVSFPSKLSFEFSGNCLTT